MQRRVSGTKENALAKVHDNPDVLQKLKKIVGVLWQTGQKEWIMLWLYG